MSKSASDNHRPLCVDLDGTLIASDTFAESVLRALLAKPLRLLAAPIWLLRGKAYLKRRVAELATPDPKLLPYRRQVIAFLRGEADRGRRIVLATGADELVAAPIAEHLGFFDGVVASDGKTNRTGQAKVNAIREYLGHHEFDYLGNSRADLPIWQAAREALVVAANGRIGRQLSAIKEPHKIFQVRCNRPIDLWRSARPHQWPKNLLMIIPMLVGHEISLDVLGTNLWRFLLGFASFSLCASSVYLFNDLLDVEADRRHATKKHRPLAAGNVSPAAAMCLLLFLLGGGLCVGSALGIWYLTILLLYMLVTTLYSVSLKRVLILDVLVLAGLYTHRIVAGGAAVEVWPSPWLLAFSMFLFLSLAFVKRYSELIRIDVPPQGPAGRGYVPLDVDLIRTIGPASGYMAVLVFCLYINSPAVGELYRRPQMLWGICPVLLYWITRMWFLANREVVKDDPVVFTLRDRVSYIAGAVVLALVLLAKLSP